MDFTLPDDWYSEGDTVIATTAISTPDVLFREAEALAKKRGVSRSKRYATAIAQYIEDERFLGGREQPDLVCGAEPKASELDSQLATMQSHSLRNDK